SLCLAHQVIVNLFQYEQFLSESYLMMQKLI
ncbi:MAG: hypothetical protein ACJA2G_003024, partial [Cognaticolwellia sp.]